MSSTKAPDHNSGSELLFWAYVHKNGTLRIKRWLEPPLGVLCDLEHAKQEKEQGNDLIAVVLDRPFAAPVHQARQQAEKLLNQQLQEDSQG